MSKDNWTGNWPIERAVACIDQDVKRYVREDFRTGTIGKPYFYDVAGDTPETRMSYEIGLRNGYAMSKIYIKSINEIKPPDAPIIYNDLARLTRKIRSTIGDSIQDAAYSVERVISDIADFVRAPNEYDEDV